MNSYKLTLLLTATLLGAGCDVFFTEAPPPGEDFTNPVDGLSREQIRLFFAGDENFEQAFTVETGLGPLFNHVSCEGCHPADGRGPRETALVRFSQDADLLLHLGGPQLQDRAIPGVTPERLPEGVQISTRVPPPVFGMGFIEAIPAEAILAHADPDDADGDGVSGRPNFVAVPEWLPGTEVVRGPEPQLGRFGRKANIASLLHQVVAAYHEDMGITSDFIPEELPHPQSGEIISGDTAADPEISATTALQTTAYVRLLAPPNRGPITPEVERGETLFGEIGCATCHVPTFTTGEHPVESLSGVTIHIYSDLLLHDMGEALADHRGDGEADGYEWRTTPLWGTRLAGDFLNGEPSYLHDGRASTLDEAIRLHGGEARASQEGYAALSESERAAVIAFLESL